jgi:glycosyltransferase involved in cell wall biosynthesis
MTHVFSEKKAKWAVVVPVINEGQKFISQLANMQKYLDDCDLVIADGGSSDGSTDLETLKGLGVTALLIKTGPGKLSAQLRMGFAWCLDKGYEGVITVDGNGKDGVDAIPNFVRELEEGMDFVQGSRYLPGGKAINTPLDRHIAVRCLHAPLISLSAGYHYTDTTNGFRAFSAKLLSDPRVAVFRDIFDTYNLHYYLAIRAARLGFAIKEIPVTRAYPEKGKTPTKISGMQGRLLILRQLLEAVFHRYDPKV